MKFEQFGLQALLLKAIEKAGFQTPSEIQQRVIPLILEGKDVVGQAKTGTGKTAAFGLPALHMMNSRSGKVELLVITPTRELATQVSDEIQRFGAPMGITSVSICGGRSYSRQIDSIRQGAQVVVATPGRLLDLLDSKRIPKLQPSIVVLDEADEMLDMGFLEDIQRIFEFLPAERQTLLFSATMPQPIQRLAKRILKNPEFVSIVNQGGEMSNQDIKQQAYLVDERERDDALVRLIDSLRPFKSIIFCRTRNDVDRLNQALVEQSYVAASLHGDIEQRQREKVIGGFRDGKIQILVATDVAARGLNVIDVTHVFNYHMPCGAETYVHRIGRTGRAGNKGIAITLLTPEELHKLKHIKNAVKSQIDMCVVPSLKDVKKLRVIELMEQVKHQPIHADAQSMLKSLEKDLDANDIATKLISLFLRQQHFAGPETIGPNKEQLDRVIERMSAPRQSRDRDDNRRGGPRRRPGGGSRYNNKRPFRGKR